MEAGTVSDVAKGLVALVQQGKFAEAMAAYYSPDIVSVEQDNGSGSDTEARGMAAVQAKGQWWMENHDVHSFETFGPYLNNNQFAVRMLVEATFKPSGKRFELDEIGIYTVEIGKIVHERFFYRLGEA